MKNLNFDCKILFVLFFVLVGSFSFAQTSEGFSYQSLLRNAAGEPLQQETVNLIVTISSQSSIGAIVYEETHSVTTSDIGLISIIIGSGTQVSGDFNTIDWSNAAHFVTTTTTPTGGTPITSSSQLLSVPYAKFAAVSGVTNQQVSNVWGQQGDNIDENVDFLASQMIKILFSSAIMKR